MQANWIPKLSIREMMEIIEIRGPFIGKRLPSEHPASLESLARVYGCSCYVISQVARKKLKILKNMENGGLGSGNTGNN